MRLEWSERAATAEIRLIPANRKCAWEPRHRAKAECIGSSLSGAGWSRYRPGVEPISSGKPQIRSQAEWNRVSDDTSLQRIELPETCFLHR